MGGLRVEVDPHRCFACGELNEHGLHLILHAQDERCWTELVLDERFQGWEGIAHGGILCAILDEVMAWSLVEHDAWGVTARLNVEFRRPVQVGTAIRAEGWMTETNRRLLRTAGRIVDAGTGDLLATGEATYVVAPPERKAELKARYRFRLVPEGSDSTGAVDGRTGADGKTGTNGKTGAGR
jgi:uncharacterized protein (TIGR00369 family)